MIIPIVDTVTYYIVLVMTGLVGLCVGSFLNVVIYRVPNGMSIAMPPSHCPNCNYQLKWYDNIPIFSYLFLGGKCRSCKKPISPRYIIVEALHALLWVLCVVIFRQNIIYAGIAAVACSVCICVFFIDLEHMIILDRFQIIMGVLGVVAIFCDTEFAWYSHLIGGVSAFAVFVLVDLIMSKSLGKEALGGGDIKFVTVCGLFLGWQKLIIMMLFASLVGSVVMIILKKKRGESTQVPFAPFLTGGFVLAMFLGNVILNWYTGLFAI